jgi:hypothetical protein
MNKVWTSYQKQQVRRIVELSTSLNDLRYGKFQRWQTLERRILEAKRELNVSTSPQSLYIGEAYQAAADRKAHEAAQAIKDLQPVFEELSRELEALGSDCTRAGQLADRLLVDRDRETLAPLQQSQSAVLMPSHPINRVAS